MSSAALMQLRAALVHCATASTVPVLASLASSVAYRGCPTKHLLQVRRSPIIWPYLQPNSGSGDSPVQVEKRSRVHDKDDRTHRQAPILLRAPLQPTRRKANILRQTLEPRPQRPIIRRHPRHKPPRLTRTRRRQSSNAMRRIEPLDPAGDAAEARKGEESAQGRRLL